MHALGLVALAALAAAPVEKNLMQKRWIDALWPPSKEVRFSPTNLQEREAFAKLIPEILKAAPTTKTPANALLVLAKSAGFTLDVWTEGGETFWTVREVPGHYRGAGAYVFRTGKAADIVIQAPHADFDVGTGTLGALLFLNAPADRKPRAFITNTAHRYKSRPDEKIEDEDHP